jgi:hypothetical protein
MNNYKKYDEFLNESLKFNKAGIKDKWKQKLDELIASGEEYGTSDEDWHKNLVKTVEDAIKRGGMKWDEHVPTGAKVDKYAIFNGMNAYDVAKQLGKIIDKYSDNQVATTQTGAMAGYGNTKATVSGMITGMVNEISYGSFGSHNTVLLGIKVGSGVKGDIKNKIFQEAYDVLFLLDEFNSTDGGIKIYTVDGTNWGCIGLASSQFGFNDAMANKLKSKINK